MNWFDPVQKKASERQMKWSNIGPSEYLSLNPGQIMHLLTALDFLIRWERVESQGL